MSAPISVDRPARSRSGAGRHRRLRLRHADRLAAGLRNRALLPDGHAGLRFPGAGLPGLHKLLGPIVPGATLPGGARVPGTSYELEPVMAAFNIGAMIRWLDFNDTWLAAEWGHPSDNLGGILATADYLSRQARLEGESR